MFFKILFSLRKKLQLDVKKPFTKGPQSLFEGLRMDPMGEQNSVVCQCKH